MIAENRIILKNAGHIDPSGIDDYIACGGYSALGKAQGREPGDIVEEIAASGLRGRGGAGFPTGIKKKAAAGSVTKGTKYVVCNADEGEPGTFKDRMIMENDPHLLIEGMIIAALAIGSGKGFIYIRGEYYRSVELLHKAIDDARKRGMLGQNIQGSGFSFDLEI
ncbi:MAG: NADP oxidoreductase, partial [Bacteroidetes bacterium]|nr:NADP oxidoreductase [Bacteroidota bacterium]